jgi:hypothetical protein
VHVTNLPFLKPFSIADFRSARHILTSLILTLLLTGQGAKGQLVVGEYAEITVGTDSHTGSPNNGCYDYEHHFSFLNPYIFGMDLYLVVDSIQGADSIGVWKYPAYQETPVFVGEYIQIYDGFSSNNLYYYFYETATVYFSIRAIGTPLLVNQAYDCMLNIAVFGTSDGCSNLGKTWYGGPQNCTVLEGEIETSNANCGTAINLIPGMNWVHNYGVNTNDSLDLSCWNNGTGGAVQRGVWYTFTTPNVPIELNLETSSSNCDTVELSGAQIAIFESCNSEALFCSSPGDGGFGELQFECGELPANTTYYVLIDSYGGQEGICNLSYQLMYTCQDPGCLDPDACNFDPDAEIDDESCLYGSECDPVFTITVDTISCANYMLEVDPFTTMNGSYGFWIVNGSPMMMPQFGYYDFQPTSPGTYEICYVGNIGNFQTSTCIELYVDPTCFEPCANEIALSSDSAGCLLSLIVFPMPPTNASYNWDLGNGLISNIGPSIDGVFEESGIYEVCVEVSSASCTNIQVCDSIEISNCPLTDPISGCIDPAACNYDPEASVDNALCEYGDACIPGFELIVDTVSCSEFTMTISPFQLFFPGEWHVNGVTNGSQETLTLNFNDPGTYEICYSGSFSGLDQTSTCIELAVDSACFLPCFMDILVSIDSTGCEYSFEIPPPIPVDAEIGWFLDNGTFVNWTNLPVASNTYENDGNYNVLVFMNSIHCENAINGLTLEVECSLDDITGCTDMDALNFDPEADTDDGSCIYDPNCLISFLVVPDFLDSSNLILFPSFDPLDAIEVFWSFGDGAVSYDPFPTHSYADEGPYLLCCSATFVTSDSLECTSDFCMEISGSMTHSGSGPFSLKLLNTGSLSASNQAVLRPEIILWPNPNPKGNLYWKVTTPSSKAMRMDIYASNGIHLHGENIGQGGNSNSGTVDTSLLAKGLYFMVIETGDDLLRSTFIVN